MKNIPFILWILELFARPPQHGHFVLTSKKNKMAIIISISENRSEHPILAKLKAMDKKRCEKMIAAYKN